MVFSVAGQRAGAAASTIALIEELTTRGRSNVLRVKVDQVRLARNSMRIMTRRAGGLRSHDMLVVSRKTLIRENAGLAVALVAKRIVGSAFDVFVRK